MNVRYTLTALAEIEEILAYVRERNPAAAAAMRALGKQVVHNTLARCWGCAVPVVLFSLILVASSSF